jgi:hypothetical protein
MSEAGDTSHVSHYIELIGAWGVWTAHDAVTLGRFGTPGRRMPRMVSDEKSDQLSRGPQNPGLQRMKQSGVRPLINSEC